MPTTTPIPSTADRITRLLVTADSLLTNPLGAQLTTAGRHRGAAYALRIALELAIAAALKPRNAKLPELNMRAQRLCLRHYAGHDLAYRVDALYAQLCRGCKYHHDELGPSEAQVRDWGEEVAALSRELAGSVAVPSFPAQAGPDRTAAADAGVQPSAG
ncbi:hypothetical protein ABT026_28250 [Streptomyces sp. NPDC002734]|uniref:hypothetical protein n=1 Tax=Streptomyces sp. NPDC002734 TaxID=3154426 RepID=UPI00332BFAE2